jgi:hypothetical protein
MATPNVVVTVTDFMTAPQPATLSGYLVQISTTQSGYTDTSGVVTFLSVTPGTYTLQIFGLGVMDREIVVPDEAGPINASDVDGAVIVNSGGFTDFAGAKSIESSVSGGASSVAFTFDTTNALAGSGSKLVEFKNATRKMYAFYAPYARLDIAPNIEDVSNVGISINSGDEISWMNQSIKDDSDVNWTIFFGQYENGDGDVKQGLAFVKGATNYTLLDPGVDYGGAPYVFDTTAAVISGNLCEVKNNGTNKFAVDFAGRIITPSAAPAAADSTGVAGSIAWDAGFIYVCTATNTWKRVAIATWP